MQDALLYAATHGPAADAVTAGSLLLLAATRWWGFLWAAPLPGRSAVPIRARFGLALLMAVLVLPALQRQLNDGAHPQQLENGLSPITAALAGSHANGPSPAPALLTLGVLAVSEFVLGLVLGFGMRIVLAGIQLAGELIDQQAGIALAEVFNPALQQRTTPTGDWLVWTAVAVFLAPPLNGELRTVALMLDLFDVLPVASGPHIAPAGRLVMAVVQQSLALSLQLALPVLAVMALISLATCWASRGGRPMPLWPGMVPLRITLSLLLLAMGATGSADQLLARFSGWIAGAQALLSG
jgi:flagellar biosynthetic protein FliR